MKSTSICYAITLIFSNYWKCNFPMNPSCTSVGRLIPWVVVPSDCLHFLKGRQVTLPCSYRSTCFLYTWTKWWRQAPVIVGVEEFFEPLNKLKVVLPAINQNWKINLSYFCCPLLLQIKFFLKWCDLYRLRPSVRPSVCFAASWLDEQTILQSVCLTIICTSWS